jgi:hypothetical protein
MHENFKKSPGNEGSPVFFHLYGIWKTAFIVTVANNGRVKRSAGAYRIRNYSLPDPAGYRKAAR